jgi:hypothetical protein
MNVKCLNSISLQTLLSLIIQIGKIKGKKSKQYLKSACVSTKVNNYSLSEG